MVVVLSHQVVGWGGVQSGGLKYVHKFFDTPFRKKWRLVLLCLCVGWT